MVLPDSSHPIRILFFQQNPVYGASEYHLRTLAERCCKDGYSTGILYPNVPELKIFSDISGISIFDLPLKYFVGHAVSSAFRIAKIIREFRPHIIYVNDPSLVGIMAAKLAGVYKIIVMHHAPEHRIHYNWKGSLASKLSFPFVDCFIFTTPFGQELAIQQERIPIAKTRVIPHGIDIEGFSDGLEANRRIWRSEVRKDLGIDSNAIVLASAGRLSEEKDYLSFIRAAKVVCAQIDNAQFVVVGEGKLRPFLEQQIKRENLAKRFLLPGFQSPIIRFLSAADIFVMPSVREGLCYAVLEASFMGLPVIASSVGGLRYSVLAGETGILIPQKDPDALVQAMLDLIHNPSVVRDMGKKGRERVLKSFTVEQMVHNVESLYAELLGISTDVVQ